MLNALSRQIFQELGRICRAFNGLARRLALQLLARNRPDYRCMHAMPRQKGTFCMLPAL